MEVFSMSQSDKIRFTWISIWLLYNFAHGDIFLHNPRGSNNRLNEKSAQRTTNNRLFDSQNNNRGGYNVGDASSNPAGADEKQQYQMRYFQSSATANTEMEIEWTMQHGCGMLSQPRTPKELDCQVILQYMCQDQLELTNPLRRLRDGTSTTRQDYTFKASTKALYTDAANAREKENVKADRGLHENWNNYENCYIRERNKGLFTADVQLAKKGDYSSAIHTRQNANGNQNGYECPEERDYYPYWHPTPWKDIAILVSNMTQCRHVKPTSFNVQPKHECTEFDAQHRRIPSRWNNAKECQRHGGQWLLYYNYLEKAPEFKNQESCLKQSPSKESRRIWGIPYDSEKAVPECLLLVPPPVCKMAPWARANHLGNSDNGRTPHYVWTLPHFPSGRIQSCVLRVRYNISTYDYDPTTTDYRNNQDAKLNITSPVQNNPLVNIVDKASLQLTIATNQLGRTFQDRSHTFWLMPRPSELTSHKIRNLNVRGKRGNIVQTFTATEYDFVPTVTRMSHTDLLHIQWTGSNTHNNQQPSGDGQVGADGVGTAGTDRHNIVEIKNLAVNYPLPFEEASLWKNAKIKWIYFEKKNLSAESLALNVASAGYYRCINATECPEPGNADFIFETKTEKLNPVLNNAPASYQGVVIQLARGTYYFMCTRNNNFSNRSQKGFLIVY